MRKISILFLILFLMSCSSDSPMNEPDINQQTDDELVIEEDEEIEDEEIEDEEIEDEEESFSFPFSLTVVLKNFSNPALQEGEFLSVDFMKNSADPSSTINLTSLANLDLNAFSFENGQDNILIFA